VTTRHVGRCQHDGGSRYFRNDEVSAWRYIPRDYDLNIILQRPVALCNLTSCSHSLPSLCNFVDVTIFTLQRLRLFSLHNTTCFGLTGHRQVYDWRNLLLCDYAVLPTTQKHHEWPCWPVASSKQNSHTQHKRINQHSNITNAETEYT
jgi:hypothetical protein